MTPEQQKFYDIKHTTDYKVVGEDIDYKVLVDDQKKQVVLQFEESDSRQDWIHNFQFLPWPLKLTGKGVKVMNERITDKGKIVWTTRGYACAYKSTKAIPVQELLTESARHLDYDIVIRGWSFGSAMAKIAARHLIFLFHALRPKYTIDELTTYGDVKCWLNPFYSAKKQCKRIREYVNANDLATWCELFYSRDVKNRVGPRFSFSRAIHTEYNHTHYEEYDYSKWED
jgi:predicted lipase